MGLIATVVAKATKKPIRWDVCFLLVSLILVVQNWTKIVAASMFNACKLRSGEVGPKSYEPSGIGIRIWRPDAARH